MRLGQGVGGAERERGTMGRGVSSRFFRVLYGRRAGEEEVEAAPLAAKSASLAGGLGLAGFSESLQTCMQASFSAYEQRGRMLHGKYALLDRHINNLGLRDFFSNNL